MKIPRALEPVPIEGEPTGESPVGVRPTVTFAAPGTPPRGVTAEEREMLAGPVFEENSEDERVRSSTPPPAKPPGSFWSFGGTRVPARDDAQMDGHRRRS
jgi:hypothetical protein